MDPQGRPPESPGEDDSRSGAAAPASGRLDATRAAYALLLSIARADTTIGSDERAMLQRYRRVLEIDAADHADALTAERLDPLGAAPVDIDVSAISAGDRVHLLRMMFRVAYADGRCHELELSLLRRIADAMRLNPIQFAEVRDSIEREVRQRRRTRLVGIVGLLLSAVLAVWLAVLFLERPKVVTVVDPELIEQFRENTVATQAALTRLEELRGALLDEQESLPAPSPSLDDETRALIDGLKTTVARLERQPEIFKQIERRYSESVVLIIIGFDLVGDRGRRTLTGFGSGFFVSPTGLILTNKHVVQPWKFEAQAVRLIDEGYRLDEDSIRIAAWIAGERVWQAPGKAIFGNAYNNLQGTLEIVATPDDEFEQRTERLPDGTTWSGRYHKQNNADLALLAARVDRPVTALPLAHDPGELEKLDPVMVLGFPSAAMDPTSERADTVPSLGFIRSYQDTVIVSNSIAHGSSGSPVIDLDGRVVAIASRRPAGEAGLGICIHSRHAMRLLELRPAG